MLCLASAAFGATSTCHDVKALYQSHSCCAASDADPTHAAIVTCQTDAELNTPYEMAYNTGATVTTTCAKAKNAYEVECCGEHGNHTMWPYLMGGGDIYAKAGSHLSMAEPFSGTKIQALIAASECVDVMPAHDWQADPRSPKNSYCAAGAFDGLQAMPVKGDGTMQTPVDGETYMRTFVNTEITSAPSDDRTPVFYISTVENKGGFGQQAPNDDERLKMYGAQEFFIDYNRQTLEAVNGGQAIKKVYTAQKAGFNVQWDGSLKAADIYGIVTNYSQLHNNVQPSMTMRYNPDCSETSDARSCGLNGHCGSKLCPKHEFSYTVGGSAAYGATSGVGFEDDVLLIAEEGHPLAGWGDGEAITGTVQALDVATGNLYQLPHLSVGVIEMAFSISTGHPDYIAVGIEEYGISGEYDGEQGGSRWSVWIGKKDLTSDNFLDRNGLAPNSGRIYVYVADDGTTDMAEYLEWPESGSPSYVFTPKNGKLKPIDRMFDGRYSAWYAALVNTRNTTDGSRPIRMTNRGKQEWGAVNPDAPNQWAIAETGLGGSTGGKARGCEAKTADCPMGTSSSTVSFLEADFLVGFNDHTTGATTSRDGATMPDYFPAKVNGVLADQVYMGPNRLTGGGRGDQRGFAAVDSLLWLKGDKLLASEDSYGPGGFNMGILYDKPSRKSVPIVGAISRDGRYIGKMNAAAMAPFGSFSGTTNQEMTGFFDASPALTLAVPYTPQQWYDALDAKHIIVNNQMKGSAGPMNEGFYYSAQTHFLTLPDIDFATYPTNPTTIDPSTETHYVNQYGTYRRKLDARKLTEEDSVVVYDDWHIDHLDLDTNHH